MAFPVDYDSDEDDEEVIFYDALETDLNTPRVSESVRFFQGDRRGFFDSPFDTQVH